MDNEIISFHESVNYLIIYVERQFFTPFSCIVSACVFLTAVSDKWNGVGVPYTPRQLNIILCHSS